MSGIDGPGNRDAVDPDSYLSLKRVVYIQVTPSRLLYQSV